MEYPHSSLVKNMKACLVELRDDLIEILRTEQSHVPDWDMIADACTKWIDRLNKTNCVNLVDDFTYHYLEDFEIRQYDQKYARQQHKKLELRLGIR
jgi:hypothetical protein